MSENKDSDVSRIQLLNFPGGPESFELAAKFCYSVNFEITSSNAAQLCCASEYLEMTEEYSTDNLASHVESYLDNVAYKSLEFGIEVLKQCERLLPLADELQIVNKCVDAIASKACTEQIASSFSRLEYSSSGRLHMNKQTKYGEDWWIEDLSVLRIDLYEKVIVALRCRGVRPESIGASLVNYAEKTLKKPSLWNTGGVSRADPILAANLIGEKVVVETIGSLLPAEKPGMPVTFLFGLLRTAMALECTTSCRINLERRIGSQLEFATLDDLLIPSLQNAGNTVFDVDVVHRVLVNFSQQEDSDDDWERGSGYGSDGIQPPSQTALIKVARLMDNYLAEIAPDANLKVAKFMAVAETLPAYARTTDDGLYRAIDIYLKAHDGLSEVERKKLCKLIDFQKLSEEAGAHAAQNERLPLQTIVQVLYFEQVRLRNALCYSCTEDDPKRVFQPFRECSGKHGMQSGSISPRDKYASLRRENRELKLELGRMRIRLNDLEKGQACMRQDIDDSKSLSFISSISRKIGKLNLFSHTPSRRSTSPAKSSKKVGS